MLSFGEIDKNSRHKVDLFILFWLFCDFERTELFCESSIWLFLDLFGMSSHFMLIEWKQQLIAITTIS